MSHDTHLPSNVTRRQAVGLAGAAGAALLLSKVSGPDRLLEQVGLSDVAQAATTSCVLTAGQDRGPVLRRREAQPLRHPHRSERRHVQAGTPVALTMVVVDADGSCAPVRAPSSTSGTPTPPASTPTSSSEGTSGKKYLRGLQATDANGAGERSRRSSPAGTRAAPCTSTSRSASSTARARRTSSRRSCSSTRRRRARVYGPASTPRAGRPTTANTSDGIYGRTASKLLVALSPTAAAATTARSSSACPGLPSGTGTGTGRAREQRRRRARATRFRRTKTGRRILRVSSTVAETVKVRVRLSRSGTTIARKTVDRPTSGMRALDLRVPLRTAGGKARLTIIYTDARRPEEDDREDRHGPAQDPR